MIGTIFLIVIGVCVKCNYADNSSHNIMSASTAKFCKEHICREGYIYKPMYRIDDDAMKEIKKDSDVPFEMHIAIQGASNGHILLSPVERPGYSDPVYEIVIGGGGNKFTELRRNLKRNARSSVKTPGILNAFELRAFYLRITEEGIIEFGREGSSLPLLSYFDISPLEIKYFSFAAWPGFEVKFLYDCPNGNGTEPDSQEVERPLPPSEQLKMTMLKYRMPWVSPKPVMNVTLGVKITGVRYDVFQTKLITDMTVVVTWMDETMAWNPDKFNNTTSIKLRQGQIWRPKFYVYNSDDRKAFDGSHSELISMTYNGEAIFHFQTKVYTWCVDFPEEYSKWPHDEYTCSIVIQPWEAHEKISVDLMKPDDHKMAIYTDIDEVIQNEWDVLTKQVVIKPTLWNQIYVSDDNQTHQSDRLVIYVMLQRQATPFNIVFYTPLIVLLLFVLMSFWSESLTMERVWFYAGCVIVMTMGLCYMDALIPCHTIPSILILYMTVLGAVLAALLIQVTLMTSIAAKICNTMVMQSIFGSYYLRQIFCLPAVKPSKNGGYDIQEDSDYECVDPRPSSVEQMENENDSAHSIQKDLAEVIDRILFFAYSITFGIMLAEHF